MATTCTDFFIIMGMYHRVQLMAINGLLDIPDNKDLIYIYKLTSVHTGHYYIGQTGSVKDRMYQHLSTVINIIEDKNCKPLKFHLLIAEKIKELHSKDKRVKIERFTREALSVYVMALVADKETANLVESHYISKHIIDEMCLNVQK